MGSNVFGSKNLLTNFVARKRTEVSISAADAKELDAKLAIVRKRLEDLGEKF